MTALPHDTLPHPPLGRAPHRPDPGQRLIGDLRLARGRVHAAHGPARHVLGVLLGAAMTGPVFWIAPAWERARLYPPGVMALGLDPGRITFVAAPQAVDLLWTMEESLRAGVVPLVVAEVPTAPGLTAIRRLHLAAEAGAARASPPPIGLLLSPEARITGAESRWHMAPEHGAPAHDPGASGWRLTRERARQEPPASWWLTPETPPQTERFTLAPAPMPEPGA